MEEKNEAMEVSMQNEQPSNQNVSSEHPQKLSYEELNDACIRLSQQNQKMAEYIKNLRIQNYKLSEVLESKRLDYLFKVVEFSSQSNGLWKFNDDFVIACISELEQALTIKEASEDKSENTTKD